MDNLVFEIIKKLPDVILRADLKTLICHDVIDIPLLRQHSLNNTDFKNGFAILECVKYTHNTIENNSNSNDNQTQNTNENQNETPTIALASHSYNFIFMFSSMFSHFFLMYVHKQHKTRKVLFCFPANIIVCNTQKKHIHTQHTRKTTHTHKR